MSTRTRTAAGQARTNTMTRPAPRPFHVTVPAGKHAQRQRTRPRSTWRSAVAVTVLSVAPALAVAPFFPAVDAQVGHHVMTLLGGLSKALSPISPDVPESVLMHHSATYRAAQPPHTAPVAGPAPAPITGNLVPAMRTHQVAKHPAARTSPKPLSSSHAATSPASTPLPYFGSQANCTPLQGTYNGDAPPRCTAIPYIGTDGSTYYTAALITSSGAVVMPAVESPAAATQGECASGVYPAAPAGSAPAPGTWNITAGLCQQAAIPAVAPVVSASSATSSPTAPPTGAQ